MSVLEIKLLWEDNSLGVASLKIPLFLLTYLTELFASVCFLSVDVHLENAMILAVRMSQTSLKISATMERSVANPETFGGKGGESLYSRNYS